MEAVEAQGANGRFQVRDRDHAMVLARLVDDERLSKEILKQTRAFLPLK
jgi:hypothetical protein